ncbi:MAG: hypothetical protein ACLSFT_10780 [Ruminococcus callidus]
MMMSDGPHGLRKQDETGDHMGINDSIKAVCFPAGCATASSFDRGLVERMGRSSGQRVSGGKCRRSAGAGSQHQAFAPVRQKLRVLLGRSLRCRRMAASFIQGVQSQQVGTNIKHFVPTIRNTAA